MRPPRPVIARRAPPSSAAPWIAAALTATAAALPAAHALRIWEPPRPTLAPRSGQGWDTGRGVLVAGVSRTAGVEALGPFFPWSALAACTDIAPVVDPSAASAPDAVHVVSLTPTPSGPWKVVEDKPGKSGFRAACAGKALAAAFADVPLPIRRLPRLTFALAHVQRVAPGTPEVHAAYVVAPKGDWPEGTAPFAVAGGVRACASGGWASYGAAPPVMTGPLTVVVTAKDGLVATVKSATGTAAAASFLTCLRSMLAEAPDEPGLPSTTVELRVVAGGALAVDALDLAALKERLLGRITPPAAAASRP